MLTLMAHFTIPYISQKKVVHTALLLMDQVKGLAVEESLGFGLRHRCY